MRASCSSRSRASPAASRPGRCWCDLGLCRDARKHEAHALCCRHGRQAAQARQALRAGRHCGACATTGRLLRAVCRQARGGGLSGCGAVQQPQLTPLLTQLDAEAPCEEAEKREGLLAIALPAMEAALRRAPAALADADSIDESVVCVRPRPGSLFGALAAVRVLCSCGSAADRAPCPAPWRPRGSSGPCSSAAAGVLAM